MKKKKRCKILLFMLLLAIPILIAARFGSFGPWVGLREQASAPTTSTNGIKIYADANNNLCIKHEDGTIYTLNSYDPNTELTDPTSIGTLSLGSASITDSSGAIDFGNETLSTTNDITGNAFIRPSDINTKIDLSCENRVLIYGGGIIFADFYETTQDYILLGSGYDLGVADVDISLGPETDDQPALFIEGSTGDLTTYGDLTLGDANNVYHLTSNNAGTIIMYDADNDSNVVIGPVTDGTTTLGITGSLDISGQVDAGTLTIDSNSITDSSGAISFGNENLSTTGHLSIGTTTVGVQTEIKATGNQQLRVWSTDNNLAKIWVRSGSATGSMYITSNSNVLNIDGGGFLIQIDGVNNRLTYDTSTDLIIYKKMYNRSVADDANITLPSFISGCFGKCMAGNNEEYAHFIVDNDGDVTLTVNSANTVAGADIDTKLCIGTAATQEPLVIKNRLGASKNIFMIIEYY